MPSLLTRKGDRKNGRLTYAYKRGYIKARNRKTKGRNTSAKMEGDAATNTAKLSKKSKRRKI